MLSWVYKVHLGTFNKLIGLVFCTDSDNYLVGQFAARVGQQRSTISKWNRDDLEDKYLRIYEENLLLKKHARKQEDKIKR